MLINNVVLPDDGNRYELIYGVLEVTPAPFGDHENALHRLDFLLELHRPPDLVIGRHQGINLHGDPTRLRVPDTTVVRRAEFEPKYQVHPALLAVEVESASTARRDREVKKAEYEQFGIESYWIVVPDEKHPSLTAYELNDGRYVQVAQCGRRRDLPRGAAVRHRHHPAPAGHSRRVETLAELIDVRLVLQP